MEIVLVQDLSDLAPRLKPGHTNGAGLKEALDIVTKLADRTQGNPALGARLAKTPLPTLLSKLITAQPGPESDDETIDGFINLTRFVSMLGSNLATSGPAAMERLRAAKFPQISMTILLNTRSAPPEMQYGNLRMMGGVISSLTAIVLVKDKAMNKELATKDNFSGMLQVASAVYTPGAWRAEADDTWTVHKTLIEYLWTIISGLAEAGAMVDANDMKIIVKTFRYWSGKPVPKPDSLSSLSAGEAMFRFGLDLSLLYHAGKTMTECSMDPTRLPSEATCKAVFADKETIDTLFDFTEYVASGTNYGQPDWVKTDKWDQTTKNGVAKITTLARSATGNFISVMVSKSNPQRELWDRIGKWIGHPTLTPHGLAAMANALKDDASAVAMLDPPSELASVLAAALVPTTSLEILHSLMGLLRNLSIPAVNVPRLGRPVLQGVLAVRPWSAKYANDSGGMMQRQAMTLVENLVKDPELAVELMTSTETTRDLTSLFNTTPDATVRGKVSTAWATYVLALPPVRSSPGTEGSSLAKAWRVALEPGSFSLMCSAIVNAGKIEPVLATAVKAVRHAIESGPAEGNAGSVADSLGAVLGISYGQRTGIDGLAAVIAAPEKDAPIVSPEVQADALAIVKAVNIVPLTQGVKAAVAASRAAGRPVAAGAEDL